jgi:hypothetical protein
MVAIDSEGGHDGTLVGPPAWVAGTLGDALDFDGTNDFVSVPHDDALTLMSGMTFSAWVNAKSFGSQYQTILSKENSGLFTNYWFGTWQGELVFGFWEGTFQEVTTAGLALPTNTWVHLAASFDNTSKEVLLYVNGVEVHSGTIAANPTALTSPLLIGRTPAGEYWRGLLDDVKLFNEVVSSTQIAELAGGGGGGGGGGSLTPFVCSGTYADRFDDQNFSGTNGSLDWAATPWIEVGESDGATRGDVQVANDTSDFQLQIQDNDNGGEGVERPVNLAGATEAKLGLKYRRDSLDNSDDYVALLISTNGTAGPWTELHRFGTSNDSVYQAFGINISAFISENTAIRLLSSPNLGRSDRVFFDDIEIICGP